MTAAMRNPCNEKMSFDLRTRSRQFSSFPGSSRAAAPPAQATARWGSSAEVQAGANVVEPVVSSPVDIRGVQLGPGRQRFGQPHRSLTELPEPAGHVAQAQDG